MLDLSIPWQKQTFVAFDLETTGPYPGTSEIVEVGAIKWRDGAEVAQLNFLVKPTKPMGDFVIRIHGITNEMVGDCPPVSEVIEPVREFFRDSVLLAHHAAFDMGFLAIEFEKLGIFLDEPVLCTSKLAQALVRGTVNHKLQTLAKHFKIPAGTAHRATDDARTCMYVGLECFRLMGDVSTQGLSLPMKGFFQWSAFSVRVASEVHRLIFEATQNQKDIEISYSGGSLPGTRRRITPMGLVRSPLEGDWMPGICHRDRAEKRFYLSKILDITLCV